MGITQVVWVTVCTVGMAAGSLSPAIPVSFGIAALAYLLAPILRRRRLPWTVGALATLTALGLMALALPPKAGEWLIVLALAAPSVLLAISAWLEPEPARRRSVS